MKTFLLDMILIAIIIVFMLFVLVGCNRSTGINMSTSHKPHYNGSYISYIDHDEFLLDK